MKKAIAELIGTFVLVLGGVGSAVLAGEQIGYLGVALAFGLTLLTMVYTIGPISGCHINPAVTLGLLAAKKIGGRDAARYIVAQIVGGVLAAGVVLAIAKGAAGGYDPAAAGFGSNGFGAHSPEGYGLMSVLIAEIVLTALLVMVVMGATDREAPVGFAGLAIGLALTLIHLVAIPVDNCSVNPARSIATAVFTGGWALSQLWVFIVAPILGGLAGAEIFTLLRRPTPQITTRRAEQALDSQKIERGGDMPSIAE